MRSILLLAFVVIASPPASAGEWRLFHRHNPGPGTGWSYYGLEGGPTTAYPPCTGKGCGVAPPIANRAIWPAPSQQIPIYTPIPGQFNTSDLYRGYPYPGLGWFGPLTPSPRPRVPSANVYPTGQ